MILQVTTPPKASAAVAPRGQKLPLSTSPDSLSLVGTAGGFARCRGGGRSSSSSSSSNSSSSSSSSSSRRNSSRVGDSGDNPSDVRSLPQQHHRTEDEKQSSPGFQNTTARNIGALTSRRGFWGPLYSYNKEPPQIV